MQNLLQARAGLQTQIVTALLPNARTAIAPMPQPPAQWFVPMSYASGNLQLKAFVTPDPGGGRKLPLMVADRWGPNTLGISGPKGRLRMTRAPRPRKAGMLPLRGGNDNPGQREYFWGEVQDVAAAIPGSAAALCRCFAHLSGGHSTGATLALLTASAGLPVQGCLLSARWTISAAMTGR